MIATKKEGLKKLNDNFDRKFEEIANPIILSHQLKKKYEINKLKKNTTILFFSFIFPFLFCFMISFLIESIADKIMPLGIRLFLVILFGSLLSISAIMSFHDANYHYEEFEKIGDLKKQLEKEKKKYECSYYLSEQEIEEHYDFFNYILGKDVRQLNNYTELGKRNYRIIHQIYQKIDEKKPPMKKVV